jgi:hypothetical protein
MGKRKTKATRGSLSDTKPSLKPSVAYASEEFAKANIQEKLALLQAAISQTQAAGGERLPDGYPASRTKFNEWAPLREGSAPVTPNANATLKRYPDLLQSVDAAVGLVKMMQSAPRTPTLPERSARLEAARRAQRTHWTLRTIAERAAVAARREAANLRGEMVVMKASQDSAQREFERMLAAQTTEIETLRAANAALAKQLKAVIPLGVRR